MNALFITFEGLDGSGKSTHLRRAAAWMEARGLEVRTTQEPGGTPLGEAIRGVFLDPRWEQLDGRVEALLVFASRRQHLLEVIEPSLAAGHHVLCDRFTDSTRVYQGTARGQAQGWIEDLDRLATGGRRPDVTLLFDLPPEVARTRGQSAKRRARGLDRLDVEDLEFYRRVREGYLELLRRQPQRFRRIDSSGAAEATWAQVEAALAEILGAGGR
jgi:dTMP kinase